MEGFQQLEVTGSRIQLDLNATFQNPGSPRAIATKPLLELLVLGAAGLGQKALSQLLQVPGVVHLNLSLLPEEVLEVLQQLHPEFTLLIQAFHLLCELSTNLCNRNQGMFSEQS